MLRRYIANFKQTISNATTAKAVVIVEPSSSGWNEPLNPANSVERRIYVITAIEGI